MHRTPPKPSCRPAPWPLAATPLVWLALMSPLPPAAASATGSLSNFDVVNDTGEDCHGFEIELEGLYSNQVTSTFASPYIRYATPTVTEKTVDGKIVSVVRYASTYTNGAWDQSTPQFPAGGTFTPGGHSCWTGGIGVDYAASGCEHFGVGVGAEPTKTTYRWLVADPANPGQLIPLDPPVAIPSPTWDVAGNVVVAALPEVEPPPAECSMFGEAQWVKIYKTESDNPAVLEDLLSGNPAVPQGEDEVEVEWQFLQADPTCDEDGNPVPAENEFVLGGPVAEGKASVTRRYEFYKYAGFVDTEENSKEARPLCDSNPYGDPDNDCVTRLDADGNPISNGDIGEYIGAQMSAVNLVPDQPPPPALEVSFAAALPTGEVGLAYSSSAVSASGGTAPYTFTGSNLPAGLSVDSATGALSGTPTAAFDGSITVQVSDQAGQTASASAALQIVAKVGISTTFLRTGFRNRAYSATLAAINGKSPYTWSLAGGALPAGLSLNSATGVISGTPTAAGTFNPAFKVTDSLGASARKTLRLVIR